MIEEPPTFWLHHLGLDILTPEQRQKLLGAYLALYVGGYGNFRSKEARIHLLNESIHLSFEIEGEEPFRTYVPYRIVEVLYMVRGPPVIILLGPVTALMSLLAKKPLALSLGFRDALGILQILHFQMDEQDADGCYRQIVDKISLLKQVCKTCGERIASGAKFCGKCGSPTT